MNQNDTDEAIKWVLCERISLYDSPGLACAICEHESHVFQLLNTVEHYNNGHGDQHSSFRGDNHLDTLVNAQRLLEVSLQPTTLTQIYPRLRANRMKRSLLPIDEIKKARVLQASAPAMWRSRGSGRNVSDTKAQIHEAKDLLYSMSGELAADTRAAAN
jgi:hypothetical protein